MDNRQVRWGLLSTARINERLIPVIRASRRCELLAIASRSRETAERYAREWGIPRTYGEYQDMLADPDIDVVYISLPNHLHAEWAVRCAEAGKHVLCEKPLALTIEEVDRMVQAAERNPVVKSGVARPHPQYIYAGMSLQRRLIGDMLRAIREMAGGAFQNVPSSEASFLASETRADTERYYRSAAATSRDRIKLIKLIWDFVGTEFGGRQLQYEMFYSASQPVVNTRMFRAYDWPGATALVDRCLGEY